MVLQATKTKENFSPFRVGAKAPSQCFCGISPYTLYTSPYMVLTPERYTKHYYIESDRIVSKIGGGMANNITPIDEPVYGFDVLDEDDYSDKNSNAYKMIGNLFDDMTDDIDLINEPDISFWLGDALEMDEYEDAIYFYHKDHLGSSTQISDASATIIHHLEYMPYGENFLEMGDKWQTPYKFNGKEKDEETGLYYYGARYYSPELSIWSSVDPLSDKYPSISPFMYCAGNPVRLVDPDGREIVITGEDGVKTTYVQGKTYEGKDKFTEKSIATLNQINEREGGEKVLSRLTGSKSIYSIENTEGGAGTSSWGYSPKDNGGTINAGKLSSVDNLHGIEGLGNELFHGYQQDMGENPLSIDSKVGAFLFGRSLIDNFGQIAPGSNIASSENFRDAITNLLFDNSFDLQDFQKAVNNFKLGSGLNTPTDKFPMGPYSHFPILNNTNPVIKDFFPLLR